MPAISISDLNNAKRDVDHIAEVATSVALTATDRLGGVKPTVRGAVNSLAAFNVRGAFVSASAYGLKDVYTSAGIAYVAIVAHTSTSVAADLSSGKVTIHQGATREELAASAGAGLLGWIQAGAGAVFRWIRDKLRESISAEDYASIQAALDANPGKKISLTQPTYSLDTTLTLGDGQTLAGKGRKATIINYTGVGKAIQCLSSLGSGNRIYAVGMRDFSLLTTSGVTGIDADSISESSFDNLTIAGFSDAGFALHSSTSGGAVYNRLANVKAQSCGTGFKLYRDGAGLSSYTNDNTFAWCRTNLCPVGFDISGGNHNVAMHAQIEGATTVGVRLTEPATATTQANGFSLTRFENNLLDVDVGAGVADSEFLENMYVNGEKFTDAGLRTNRTGNYGGPQRRHSATQNPGGSWRYTRTANGGAQVPAFVINEASTINSPVSLELQSAATSLLARALRVRYGGDAGTPKFGIVPISGKITDLSTTNGPVGAFTCAAAAQTVINNTAVEAASLIFLQPANTSAALLLGSSKALFILTRTAGASFTVRTADNTAAAGTETFFYWMVN